jgi:hypothetical protein
MAAVGSLFQEKYAEFVADLLDALPEYTVAIQAAQHAPVAAFQQAVRPPAVDAALTNPGTILPGVVLTDAVWGSLSETSQRAIYEHLRILSMCAFMESVGDVKPAWMDEAMADMQKKLESVDLSSLFAKFASFMNVGDGSNAAGAAPAAGPADAFKGLFENGFPKLPDRFLKGQMAKLAQVFVKEITPEDIGLTPELLEECNKDPSRSFSILISAFSKDSGIIMRVIMRIGKRLQQMVQSGAIRPMEIAREAEELMKEFANNSTMVDMMSGIKTAFGMEDMDLARSVGREGTARLAMARDRLRKKLDAKKAAAAGAMVTPRKK